MFWLYILQSGRDGSYYIGQTKDLDKRIARHNLGHSNSTKAKRPWKLMYKEEYQTKSEAQKREYYLKRKKSKKYLEYLINQAGGGPV
ncbi:MAG: GIY-YIG nuclease family protein [Candidatus Erginobacter occultus]|nr:GIY-YIG nuclease family protein [Candidatus Erginobacter occultus]